MWDAVRLPTKGNVVKAPALATAVGGSPAVAEPGGASVLLLLFQTDEGVYQVMLGPEGVAAVAELVKSFRKQRRA